MANMNNEQKLINDLLNKNASLSPAPLKILSSCVAAKINELDIDVINLKAKVKNLEICYLKIAIVGSLLQDDFISNDEYHNIHQRIVNH